MHLGCLHRIVSLYQTIFTQIFEASDVSTASFLREFYSSPAGVWISIIRVLGCKEHKRKMIWLVVTLVENCGSEVKGLTG